MVGDDVIGCRNLIHKVDDDARKAVVIRVENGLV